MSLRLPTGLERVLQPPTWPGTVPQPAPERRLGIAYDTTWTRKPLARFVRALLIDNVTRPVTRLLTMPTILGLENLRPLDGPVIFAANHSSHVDTSVVLTTLPARFRHKTIVAAAADTFFDRRWKADLWSLLLGAVPWERTKVNRKSGDFVADLIADGWNLVIFPEGGRSTDGWGQEFGGYAAHVFKRSGVPVVPIHLRGVRAVFPKGSGRLRPGKVEVRFGAPLYPLPADPDTEREEDARRYAARIEAAVAALADEAESDWWSARRRAAKGDTPPFRGPEVSSWRRVWELPESARKDAPTRRRRSSARPW